MRVSPFSAGPTRLTAGVGRGAVSAQDISLAELLALSGTRRVDFVGFGDSNQVKDGYGWDHGFIYALSQHYPMYATGIICPGGTSYGIGYTYTKLADLMATSGAPSDIDKYSAGASFPYMSYAYVDGEGTYQDNNNGLLLSAGGLLDISAALRFHFCYSTFDAGEGSFRPGVRLEAGPWTALAMGDLVETGDETITQKFSVVNLPANERSVQIGGRYQVPGQAPITGPFAGHYVRAENPAILAGFSYHTFYVLGGSSLYDAAAHLENTFSTELIRMVFNEARRLQIEKEQDPVVVACVNFGLNDRNETSQPSLGPGAFTDPDSPEAYIDNLEALISRIEAVWANQGWNLGGLHWLIMPSHPVSNPDDAKLLSYRAAAVEWAANRSRTHVVDLNNLISGDEILLNGWYLAAGSDRNHLTQGGYEGLASLVVGMQ